MNIETIQNKAVVSSLEIAEITGKRHADVMRDIREQFEKLQIGQRSFASSYINEQNKEQPCFTLDQEQLLILASGYDIVLRSKIIKRWFDLEVKEQQKQETQYLCVEEKSLRLSQIAWGEFGLNDNSKLLLTHKLFNHYDIPTIALPDYTESKDTLKALSTLLKDHDVGMSAMKFNKILQSAGIIEQLTRPSSKGGEKIFWSIVGKTYGENQVSPANPRETQPLFYAEKFADLLKAVNRPSLF
jgi:Rha family phage regulatory protein